MTPMGDFALAREHYRIALEIFRKLKMLRQQAIVLGQLAVAGDPESQKLDEEELAITRQIGDKGLEAVVLHRIGDRFFVAGQFDAAQEKLTRAAALCQELDDKNGLARILTSEGQARAGTRPSKKGAGAVSRCAEASAGSGRSSRGNSVHQCHGCRLRLSW